MRDFERLATAMRRVCFAPALDGDAVEALGGDPRWARYRELVRNRIHFAIAEALPRTRGAVGESRFDAWVSRWLDESPPTTRYVRELMPGFVDWLGADRLEHDAPGPAADLLRYEVALHHVALAPDPPPEACSAGEFAMDRPARFAPVLRRLDLGWSVHEERPRSAPTSLLIYRAAFVAETLSLNASAAQLIDAMREGREDVTASLQRTLADARIAADASFVEHVAALLGELIERGVILGSVP